MWADKRFHLAGENSFETVVVARSGEPRSVGGEGYRRQAGTLGSQTDHKFRGQVLGVGGAASIAEEDELAAVANGGGAHRKLRDAGDQSVRKRLLDAGAFSQLETYFFDVRGHELLTENDFRAVTNHPAGGVARVNDELRGIHDGAIVVAGMVGGDQDGVIFPERLRTQRHGFHI